jgi:hypothetical protein
MRPVNAYANAYRNHSSKSNTHAKLAWVTYAYCYNTTFTHTYTKLARVTYAVTDGDCHSYRSAQGDTKASANAASSAVMKN